MLKIFNNNFVFSLKVILLIDKNITVKNSVEETSVGWKYLYQKERKI